MTALMAFTKKEFLEAFRTGKLLLLAVLSLLFGIMNPAVAKLTPWMMNLMAESLEETGLSVTGVTVNALSSWTQFYKNAPIAMIAFLLLFGGILASEYQRGTLINMMTKGLAGWKVVAAKGIVLTVFWSGAYWLMYGVTYAYTAYFWDNSVISNCTFAAFCVYLFGIWLVSLLLPGAVLSGSGSGTLGLAGAVFAAVYLLGIVPAVREYLPIQLFSSSSLLRGAVETSDFAGAIAVTAALAAGNILTAVLGFSKRRI